MTDFPNPDHPNERLSNAERDAAVGRLADARSEGRLSSAEFDERAASARAAVTRGDLVPLFADLPAGSGGSTPLTPPDPAEAPTTAAAYGAAAYGGAPAGSRDGRDRGRDFDDDDVDYGGGRGVRPLGGAVGATIMALIPFIALGLFFLTGNLGSYSWSWIWFMLIPLGGAIIYGPGSTSRRRRRR